MSQPDPNADGERAVGLPDLIQVRMRERGWSYSDLERASGRALTRGRWQQLGAGAPLRKFPDPGSLTVISEVLEVDITTVVLAAAHSLGLDVRRQPADLSALLPDRTEQLSGRMREAILTLVRAAVAETLDAPPTGSADGGDAGGLRLTWPKSGAPSSDATTDRDRPAAAPSRDGPGNRPGD